MAKTYVSRHDMEALADRLDAKAWSNLFLDMPETRRDLRLAAAVLRWLSGMGIPITHVELDIFNGSI